MAVISKTASEVAPGSGAEYGTTGKLAAEAIEAGDLIARNPSGDDQWYKADPADDNKLKNLAFAGNTAAIGQPVTPVEVAPNLDLGDDTPVTGSTVLYVSATAGAVDDAKPSNPAKCVIIGTGNNDGTLNVNTKSTARVESAAAIPL